CESRNPVSFIFIDEEQSKDAGDPSPQPSPSRGEGAKAKAKPWILDLPPAVIDTKIANDTPICHSERSEESLPQQPTTSTTRSFAQDDHTVHDGTYSYNFANVSC
ncbi:MAG: hypothetical protein OXH80_05310, partial [Nitrospira sp.]|nr:hypothetical protein [Nitrospira sp.]